MAYDHNEKDFRVLIEDCLDRETYLNEWETTFIFDIAENRSISINQYRKLLTIWEKIIR